MSFKGKVLVGAGIVLVVLIAGLFYLGTQLDSLVKSAIESYGSEITGTRVSVASVRLSLKDGRGTINGLTVANPEGFSGGDAIRFGELTLAFDLDSLRGGSPIVIDEARIRKPDINYERNEAGKGNLETIQENIDRYRKRGLQEPAESAPPEEQKRIRIKQFIFDDGEIHISAPQLKKPVEASLPSVRMTDVGGAEGETPPEIGKQILTEFARSAGKALAREGLQRFLDKQLGDKAGEKARGLLDSILK